MILPASSRSAIGTAPGEAAAAEPGDCTDGSWSFFSIQRRALVVAVIAVGVLGPCLPLLHRHAPAAHWFLVAGSLAFFLSAAAYLLLPRQQRAVQDPAEPVPWPQLGLLLALGIALFAVGHQNFLSALAVAAGVSGRYSATPRPAQVAALATAATGLAVSTFAYPGFGASVADVLIGPLAAFLAYSAAKRLAVVSALRRTRAELAMAAVAEERLRIARDLHDLLGHSLSLITLKAELAGRVLAADPGRAGREIAELESVARQSLADVREAVAGYRQPDLAAELAAARRLLDAAGIDTRITAPGDPGLPRAVDSALAWAVREGATNVVRHSRATRVAITVTAAPGVAVAEISDNGPADEAHPALLARAGEAAASGRPAGGSGLAGLADRVSDLGGEIAAGRVSPHGFRLRVAVPVLPQAS